MLNRKQVLEDMIEFNKPISQIRESIAQLPWHCDAPIVALTREHVRRILLRYLSGDLSSSDVEQWAYTIHGREDITLVPESDSNNIASFLYWMGYPEVNGVFTEETARKLLGRLDR